jgi:hypothetical protein
MLATAFFGRAAYPSLKIEPALFRKVQSEMAGYNLAELQKLRV